MAESKPKKSNDRTEAVKKIIARLEKAHPDAKLALDFTNPFELLIALILAAQARDELVNEVTSTLFSKYSAAEDYVRIPVAKLEQEIKRINFYRNKARTIQNCCRHLVERFNGIVPERLDDLLTLPGVGRKTANILIGNAYEKPAIGVDTHVMRLSQRLGFTRNSNPDKIEFDLAPVVPDKNKVRFCHLLQYHGRRVCLAKKPRCPECVITELCHYPEKTKA